MLENYTKQKVETALFRLDAADVTEDQVLEIPSGMRTISVELTGLADLTVTEVADQIASAASPTYRSGDVLYYLSRTISAVAPVTRAGTEVVSSEGPLSVDQVGGLTALAGGAVGALLRR